LSEHLLAALQQPPHELTAVSHGADEPLGDDGHLALYCCYELHYGGLPGVSDDWEWQPSLLAIRRRLERRFAAELERAVGSITTDAEHVVDDLVAMATSTDGPSLSAWLVEHGSLTHAREFAMHRSAYQLKEADPHTWAIPRLEHETKALMVSIQAGEYGDGRASAMHSSLFAHTLEALELDPRPHAYLDRLPGTTLATTNLISLLGLHRARRAALVGHLALFEMTSVGPMGRYSRWLERLGLGPVARAFYDAHVEADQQHRHLARAMVRALVEHEPHLAREVLFGARALGWVEQRFTSHLLGSWAQGRTSLRAG
jgi:hypothetical protein